MIKTNQKKWNIKSSYDSDVVAAELSESIGCSRVLSQLLINRGFNDADSALSFINKSQEVLHSPFLLNDMEKAVERILSALKAHENITIYGDYDVDGVTSVSILYLYLKSLGAMVDYYIPSRNDGYGMSIDAVTVLKEKKTSLIITVDTGITAISEIDFANENGIDVIVTDHHECIDFLPNAKAVINPKRQDTTYPFQHLAGVGVVFKLLCALEARYNGISELKATMNIAQGYADLTAIGTIADVMPILDENRIIVAYGLERAEKTNNLGLSKLIWMCRNGDGKPKTKKPLSSTFVGYTLGPRINAAGRISSASIAVELFLSEDPQEAEKLAYELCEINKERQFRENKIVESANEIISNGQCDDKSIIILDNEQWNHGVLGIVASSVLEKYGLPAIMISFEGNDDPYDPEAIGKGSGRSMPGLNLFNALTGCSNLLEKFGGHELAAGLTVKRKNLEELKVKLDEYAAECFKNYSLERVLDIDTELQVPEMKLETAKELTALEPFGPANPTPVFVAKNMILTDIIPVGMNRHLRLIFRKEYSEFTGMLFSVSPEEFWIEEGDEVDVAFNLEINEFSGNVSLQLNVRDIRLSERCIQIEKQNESLYQDVRNGTSGLAPEYFIPERDDFSLVYRHLLSSSRCNKETYTYSRLTNDINKLLVKNHLSYVKVKIIIKVFIELNIISIEEIDDFSFNFKISYSKNKTSLEKSNIIKKLKSIYQIKK